MIVVSGAPEAVINAIALEEIRGAELDGPNKLTAAEKAQDHSGRVDARRNKSGDSPLRQ